MRMLLVAAIVANAVITASCPLYLPPVSDEDGVLMSREVSQRCHAQEEGVSPEASAGCAGGQCVQNRSAADEGEDCAPGQPLIVAALPAAPITHETAASADALPSVHRPAPFDTHTRTVVLRC